MPTPASLNNATRGQPQHTCTWRAIVIALVAIIGSAISSPSTGEMSFALPFQPVGPLVLSGAGSITTVRPWTLGTFIEELAGQTVRVPDARILGVVNPRALLIESAASFFDRGGPRTTPGLRNRVLVLIRDGALRVAPDTLVTSNVIVVGVARTLVGLQVTEGPWPPELTRERIRRLEIRAAVLATSVTTPEGVGLTAPVAGFRLGVPAYFYDHLDAEVAHSVQEALRVLSKLTKSTKDVVLPAFTNVGNVGGAGETYAYHEKYFKRAAGRYMLPERRRLEAASKSPVTAAEYVRAKWGLDLLRRTVDDAFTDVDAVVVPTLRILPPLLADIIKAAREGSGRFLTEMVANTQPFNVYGIPAVSVPCGFSKSGLPVGLTFAGPRFSEGKLLALARAFERATEWHKRRPALSPTMPVPPVPEPA